MEDLQVTRSTSQVTPQTPKPSQKKSLKNKKITSEKIITGFRPPPEIANNLREVFLYDILGDWDSLKITDVINQTMGSLISATIKRQGKYLSLKATVILRKRYLESLDKGEWHIDLDGKMVRWYPGSWTLKERKERDQFQAVVDSVPDEFTDEFIKNNPEFVTKYNLKYYKFQRKKEAYWLL